MSNFITNETKLFVPCDPPWITKSLTTMFNRENRFFNRYKNHGYNDEHKIRPDALRVECQKEVEAAELSYLANMGNKVNNPGNSNKTLVPLTKPWYL